MLRKLQWITVLYIIGILSPYFVPAMNQLDPHLGAIPFTVWWSILLVIIYCVLLYIWSKSVWDDYDEEG